MYISIMIIMLITKSDTRKVFKVKLSQIMAQITIMTNKAGSKNKCGSRG